MKISNIEKCFGGSKAQTKVKGVSNFTGQAKKAGRSKIIRKINNQILRKEDGSVVNCQVVHWKSTSGLYYFTARQVIKAFDEDQYCYVEVAVGDKLEVKEAITGVWDTIGDKSPL